MLAMVNNHQQFDPRIDPKNFQKIKKQQIRSQYNVVNTKEKPHMWG